MSHCCPKDRFVSSHYSTGYPLPGFAIFCSLAVLPWSPRSVYAEACQGVENLSHTLTFLNVRLSLARAPLQDTGFAPICSL